MQLKDAKYYFEGGFIAGFSAVRDPLAGGFMLVVTTIGGKGETLMTAKKEVKTFSTLDSVFSEVERITGRCSEVVFKI